MGSAPDPARGAYSAPSDPLAEFKRPNSKGREGREGKGEGGGGGEGNGMGWEGTRKEKEDRGSGRGGGKEGMWRGPESDLPASRRFVPWNETSIYGRFVLWTFRSFVDLPN